MIFKNSKTSLRQQTVNSLKQKYPDLFVAKFQRIKKVKDWLLDASRWYTMPLIISGVFLTCLFIDYISFLGVINIKYEVASTILDQRISNIATTTSITLAIIGFLISNIAIKEAFAYHMLFKHSNLYPIVYFILSTLSFLFLASLLRNKESISFLNISILGTYMSIIIMILIGYLFRKIVLFTNPEKIREIFHNDLIEENKQILRDNLIFKHSKSNYLEYIKSIQVIHRNEYRSIFYDEMVIYDIDLRKLRKLKQRYKAEILCSHAMAIGDFEEGKDDFIWREDGQEDNALKTHQFLRLKAPKQLSNKTREYFDQKIEQLVDENKHKNLSSWLESYKELYKLKLDHP